MQLQRQVAPQVDCYHPQAMGADLLRALSAVRPVRAALVGAPAVAGWVWAGGATATAPLPRALAVIVVAWLLALAAFLWNDRADVLRGTAAGHRRGAVRALHGHPAAARWLLWLGVGAAAVAVALGYALAPPVAALGVVVAGAAWIYSDPVYFGKARPRAAALLHGLGGAANAAAGAWAGAGDPAAAAAWGTGCGALFTAAHLVHVVGDREEDLAAGVDTAATRMPFGRAALLSLGALAGALSLLGTLGALVGGAGGSGLVVMGVVAAGLTLALARPSLSDPGRWPVFQRRCRLAVTVGAAAGVGVTLLLRGGAG